MLAQKHALKLLAMPKAMIAPMDVLNSAVTANRAHNVSADHLSSIKMQRMPSKCHVGWFLDKPVVRNQLSLPSTHIIFHACTQHARPVPFGVRMPDFASLCIFLLYTHYTTVVSRLNPRL